MPKCSGSARGVLLAERRKQRGWTQVDLAAVSGVSITAISNVERSADKLMTLGMARRLAAALGCRPEDLVHR